MNHLSALERYHEYREIIQELLSSIITGIHEHQLISNEAALIESMQWLHKNYPFVELIYTLDASGTLWGSMCILAPTQKPFLNVRLSEHHRKPNRYTGRVLLPLCEADDMRSHNTLIAYSSAEVIQVSRSFSTPFSTL